MSRCAPVRIESGTRTCDGEYYRHIHGAQMRGAPARNSGGRTLRPARPNAKRPRRRFGAPGSRRIRIMRRSDLDGFGLLALAGLLAGVLGQVLFAEADALRGRLDE